MFKSLAFSKIVYLALLTLLPNNVIEELKHIQKFSWSNKKGKIKNSSVITKIWFNAGSNTSPILLLHNIYVLITYESYKTVVFYEEFSENQLNFLTNVFICMEN